MWIVVTRPKDRMSRRARRKSSRRTEYNVLVSVDSQGLAFERGSEDSAQGRGELFADSRGILLRFIKRKSRGLECRLHAIEHREERGSVERGEVIRRESPETERDMPRCYKCEVTGRAKTNREPV